MQACICCWAYHPTLHIAGGESRPPTPAGVRCDDGLWWAQTGWADGCRWRPATCPLGDIMLGVPQASPKRSRTYISQAAKDAHYHQQRPQPARKKALHASPWCAVGFQARVAHMHSSIHRLLQTVHHKALHTTHRHSCVVSQQRCLWAGCCARLCQGFSNNTRAPHHLTGSCHTPV